MRLLTVGAVALSILVCSDLRAQQTAPRPSANQTSGCGSFAGPLFVIDGVVQGLPCAATTPRRQPATSCKAATAPLIIIDGVVQPSSCDAVERSLSVPAMCAPSEGPLFIVDGVVQSTECATHKRSEPRSSDAPRITRP